MNLKTRLLFDRYVESCSLSLNEFYSDYFILNLKLYDIYIL